MKGATTVAPRKYAMTKLAQGDYLLPSNDGQTLWRLTEYAEDGSLEVEVSRGVYRKITGTFWQTSKYKRELPLPHSLLPEDFLDWDNWTTWETGLLKRKYAIEAALR